MPKFVHNFAASAAFVACAVTATVALAQEPTYRPHNLLVETMPEGWLDWSEEAVVCDDRFRMIYRTGYSPEGSQELWLYIVDTLVVATTFDPDPDMPGVARNAIYRNQLFTAHDPEGTPDNESTLILSALQSAGIQNPEAAFASCGAAILEKAPSIDEVLESFGKVFDDLGREFDDLGKTFDKLFE